MRARGRTGRPISSSTCSSREPGAAPPAQLAEEMDAVGGQINAFTTKECTCFYARVLDTHLGRAADILCDMFFHSRFDDADVETERG